MIKSFKDKKTKKLYEGKRVPSYQSFLRQAEKRLRVLDATDTLESLMILSSNHFEALGGNKKGEYSISINMQWRICFEWYDGEPQNVYICDYH